jgi:membrane associated rhomboid family serine protease
MANSLSLPRVTPWVGRLIAANAVVQLLLSTVLTSGDVVRVLAFDPGAAFRQPWTFLTYMFVHGGMLHLLANMLALYVFGTPVENRLGGRTFLTYYLGCGVGAAVVSLALAALHFDTAAVVGASGAVLGIAVAFAMLWPDAEILVFPIPVPIRARVLVFLFAISQLALAAFRVQDGVAHPAHLGGLLTGWLFFKFRDRTPRLPQARARRLEPAVMAQSVARDAVPSQPRVTRSAPGTRSDDPQTAEVDRVLDKISAKGIESLTQEERRFLDEVSKRKRDLN